MNFGRRDSEQIRATCEKPGRLRPSDVIRAVPIESTRFRSAHQSCSYCFEIQGPARNEIRPVAQLRRTTLLRRELAAGWAPAPRLCDCLVFQVCHPGWRSPSTSFPSRRETFERQDGFFQVFVFLAQFSQNIGNIQLSSNQAIQLASIEDSRLLLFTYWTVVLRGMSSRPVLQY